MGLMILAILIGAAAAAGSLLLGGSLWLALSLYAVSGAGFILIAATAIYLAHYLAKKAAPQSESQEYKVHS